MRVRMHIKTGQRVALLLLRKPCLRLMWIGNMWLGAGSRGHPLKFAVHNVFL
jgi:hypothetical protein